MAKAIEFLDGAQRDYDQSYAWYRERSEKAVDGFVAAVETALDKIVEDPGRFATTFANCRYCILYRYPFRIVFREEAERIVVVAVAHARRRSGYWQGRT